MHTTSYRKIKKGAMHLLQYAYCSMHTPTSGVYILGV